METRSQAGGRFGWIGAGVVGWAGVGSGMEKRSRARTRLRVASAVVFCWEVADHRGIERARRTPHLAYSFLRHVGLSVS
jgi:hypothetical protein